MRDSAAPLPATLQPGLTPTRLQVLVIACMLALAGLDLLFSWLAKEWALRGVPLLFLGGLAAANLLFVVYALSLRVATLSVVTLGWVVLVSVGVVLLDRFRYGTQLHLDHWGAIALLLFLVAYLVVIRPPS